MLEIVNTYIHAFSETAIGEWPRPGGDGLHSPFFMANISPYVHRYVPTLVGPLIFVEDCSVNVHFYEGGEEKCDPEGCGLIT